MTHGSPSLALGGFSTVYVARDIQTGTDYALKRLFGSDKDECNLIIQEINLLKQVTGHPNIVKFIAASFIDRTAKSGRAEYLVVTELCHGSLFDCLAEPLEPQTVLKTMYQATKAVAYLNKEHNVNHRDIKVENFLIGSDGLLKLCDFGSATFESYAPDIDWSAAQRNSIEEIMQKFTTPMYRAPEQLDTWQNFPIGVKTDVWALGCILFCMCYRKHPFEDAAKLAIINGNFNIPTNADAQRFACFNDIIRGCFVVDPTKRLDVTQVLERLGAISETMGWSLKGPLGLKTKPVEPEVTQSPVRPPPPRPVSNPPARPQPPSAVQQPPLQQQQPAAGGLFSSFKGGAGSWLKNLKDTSSKVMQSVQVRETKACFSRSQEEDSPDGSFCLGSYRQLASAT